MAELINVSDQNFESEVLKSDVPVLVDFWAEWCNPCKMIAPIVEKIAREFEGKVKVAKVDVDSNPDIASKFGIRSIPTVMIFKEGGLVEQVVGVVPEPQLKKLVEKVI